MVFKLERLPAICTLEPPLDRGIVMADHVSLQPVHVRKLFLAHRTLLQIFKK